MLNVDWVVKNLLCTMLSFPLDELKALAKTRAGWVSQ